MTRLLGMFGFVLLLVLLFSAGSSAQSTISIGPQLGLNLASISVDPEPEGLEIDRTTFFMIGGFAEFRLGGGFALQPELWYLGKGAEGTSGGEASDVSLSYLEVPVLAKYTFESGGFKPFLIAGPYIGLNMSAELNNEDIDEFIEAMDFGLVLGAGGEFALQPKTALFFTLRYSLGLTEIQSGDYFGTTTIKTDGIQLTVGAKFDL